ncbi:hypothetical protein [Streptomyces anulatus]|uniref:Mce-associated membrane protein n=1 Tax=Streptomyces anulatus TaxID=1892 RepID=A0A7K3RKR3_STRAQ|nr:hypothetical protein [Streptomyces anulatus]NEC02778.1 hypothetical protein [Streptomyces anulatus]NED25337.1 hypothetical protein [Streptomyces anulatus]
MSTTRHLVNRRRRLATAPPRTPGAEPDPASAQATATATEPQAAEDSATAATATATDTDAATDTGPRAAQDTATDFATDLDADLDTDAAAGSDTAPDAPGNTPRDKASRLRVGLPAVLCALTVLLGAFAVWAFASAGDLRDEPARQNAALTDIGRTSEVKGRISEAVGAVFSYDYASPARSDRAASTYLTGRAVRQHKDMLADVREQAPKQKLVLTTTVTESGVEFLDGDRARLLIFADQSNTRTGKDEETTYAAAMFAVDAVRRGDTWLIAAIDTFTR